MSLGRIEEKVDKLQEDISEIKVTMAVNTQSLKEHMKRTEVNEEAVELLKTQLIPVQDHQTKMKFIWSMCATLGGSIASIYYFLKILEHFNH